VLVAMLALILLVLFSNADDIVILAPTPTAMIQLLAICDSCASEFDIVLNADKSRFLVVAPNKRRAL